MKDTDERALAERLCRALADGDRPGGLAIARLLESLHLPHHARRALTRVLRGLVGEGKVVAEGRGRYRLAHARREVVGRLAAGSRGWAVIEDEADGRPLARVAPEERGGAVPGDSVRAVLEPSQARREVPNARVEEILARGGRPILGTFWRQGRGAFVLPGDDAQCPPVKLAGSAAGAAGPADGDLVVVALEEPKGTRPPTGRLVAVLGKPGTLAAELGRLHLEHGLAPGFPDEVEAELARAPADGGAADRVDLRDQALVTIDPDTARDFDDAVWVERAGRGFRLWVAIADVAAYVPPGSSVDAEALRRGCSVYLPGEVFPMLPRLLSEGLCSLAPGEERAAMVLELGLDAGGKVRAARACRARIRSRARLTYSQVQAALDGAPGAGPAGTLAAELRLMAECAGLLLGRMTARGALDFDLPESEILLGKDGRPQDVRPARRLFAHRLVEAFMVAANEAVASGLTALGAPLVYRTHLPPDADRLAQFTALATALGAPARFGERPTPLALSRYLSALHGRPGAEVLEHHLLRSLMQARYGTECEGHFGLASACYLHFTSPIRRYPDLCVHRQLGGLLERAGAEGLALAPDHAPDHGAAPGRRERFPVSAEEAARVAAQSSRAERRAVLAEREASGLYHAAYLEPHVGEVLDGVVAFPTEFGAFVRLAPSGIEGLVHMARMQDDYYEHDPERLRLRGRRTGRVIAVGQRVRVRVESVSLARRQVELAFVEEGRR